MSAPVITRRSDATCTVLDIVGDVDVAALASVRRALAAVAHQPARVIVDLSHVGVLDSGLFGTLLSVQRQIRAQGGSLRLVVFGERLRQHLASLGLDGIFDVHQSVSAARAAIDNDAAARLPVPRGR